MFEKLKTKAKQLKVETYTLFLAYRHPATPWYAKVFAAVIVAYAFSPIDLIPDFIPVLGYFDDLILVPLGIKLALKMIPQDALIAARLKASNALEAENTGSRAAGVIIILIWITLIMVFVIWCIGWIRELNGE